MSETFSPSSVSTVLMPRSRNSAAAVSAASSVSPGMNRVTAFLINGRFGAWRRIQGLSEAASNRLRIGRKAIADAIIWLRSGEVSQLVRIPHDIDRFHHIAFDLEGGGLYQPVWPGQDKAGQAVDRV